MKATVARGSVAARGVRCREMVEALGDRSSPALLARRDLPSLPSGFPMEDRYSCVRCAWGVWVGGEAGRPRAPGVAW